MASQLFSKQKLFINYPDQNTNLEVLQCDVPPGVHARTTCFSHICNLFKRNQPNYLIL